jgi:hypothetical protein
MKYLIALLIVILSGCDTTKFENGGEDVKVKFSDGSFVVADKVFKRKGWVSVVYKDGTHVAYPWRMISSIDYGK